MVCLGLLETRKQIPKGSEMNEWARKRPFLLIKITLMI
jgi:hypothetical protein